MTSQLNVDTIVDKAGSGGTNVKIANTSVTVAEGGSGTTNTAQGLCKAWSITSGSDATSDDSFNYTSNTDNGTGDYSHGLTNNLNSTSYSVPATCGQDFSGFAVNKARATNSVRVLNVRHDNLSVDVDQVHTVHGDLA